MIDKNEVKKDLYKSKNMAKFSHYVSGNLYYTVELSDGIYQFPISTVEYLPAKDYALHGLHLAQDLGTTSFTNEMKGSDLNRWIGKAIDNGEFNKIAEKTVVDRMCKCGKNEKLIGEYYCKECLDRNPFLCA